MAPPSTGVSDPLPWRQRTARRRAVTITIRGALARLLKPFPLLKQNTPLRLVIPPVANEYSLDFDGVDDYVDCGDVLNMGLSSFTIGFWFNPSILNLSTNKILLAKPGWGDIK